MIRAVIFDVGGVLVDDAFPGMIRKYASTLGVTDEEFLKAHTEESVPWQKGEISEAEYWKRICTKLNRPLPKIDSLWVLGLEVSFHPRSKMFEFIKTLKSGGYKIAILSNTEMPNAAFMKKNLAGFDQYIFSCEVDFEKPERQIYEEALERLNIKASEVIFIDDTPANVEGAQTVGIRSVLFRNEEQAQDDINRIIASQTS